MIARVARCDPPRPPRILCVPCAESFFSLPHRLPVKKLGEAESAPGVDGCEREPLADSDDSWQQTGDVCSRFDAIVEFRSDFGAIPERRGGGAAQTAFLRIS